MTDRTLARIAGTPPTGNRGWVCRTRVDHLDWRPLVAAGLVEQSPALGHIRLSPAGRDHLDRRPDTSPDSRLAG
jgi:hypothetical protein